MESNSGLRVIQAPGGVEVVLIDGVLPTSEEWDEVFARDYRVNVISMPDDGPSLEPLLVVADRLTNLAINSYSCSDLRAIDAMANLRALVVGGRVSKSPTLERAVNLETFWGPVKGFEKVANIPSLVELRFDSGGRPIPLISSRLRTLTLTAAARVEDLSSLLHPEFMEKLVVHGSRVLDLSRLKEFVSLETLQLEQCDEILGVESLLGLPNLRTVFLENCPRIDHFDRLLGLQARVTVIARNPFNAAFRSRVSTNWTFPPGAKYLPRD